MSTVSDVLHRLGTQGAGSQSLSIAVNTRYYFDDVSIETGLTRNAPLGPPHTSLCLRTPSALSLHLTLNPRELPSCEPTDVPTRSCSAPPHG